MYLYVWKWFQILFYFPFLETMILQENANLRELI